MSLVLNEKHHINQITPKKYLIFLIMCILGYAGVIASLIGGDDNSSNYKYFWMTIYLFTLIIFFLTQKKYVRKTEIFILFFGIYVVSTSLWSIAINNSLTYSVSYFMNIMTALIIARIVALENFLKILLYTLFTISFIGIIITFLGYEKGYFFDPLDRSNLIGVKLVQGLFSHKIYSGLYNSIGAILAYNILRTGILKKIIITWFIFAVLISGSSLGLLILVLAFYLNKQVPFFKNKSRRPLAIIYLLTLLLLFLVGNNIYEEVLLALGRDPGLTGRTELWKWGFYFFSQSPIIGWGYGGIFTDTVDAPAKMINTMGYYSAPHFHNGYLQALSELGLIGSLSLFFMMAYVLIKSINIYFTYNDINFLLVFVILALLMIAALGMNLFMRYNELSIFILVYFYLTLTKFHVESVRK